MTRPDGVIRILLVDDHRIFRIGLKAAFASIPDISVVGEAADGVDAIEAVERFNPDVVLMDLDMPNGDGVTATKRIAAMPAPPKVLILSMHSEEERLVEGLQAGASGFLSKDVSMDELVEAIRTIAAGDTYVRPRAARLLASSIRPATEHRSVAEEARTMVALLSERERAVLRFVAEGHTGPEIGARLGITTKTVDTYRQRISNKLGFKRRSEYVRLALNASLVHAGPTENSSGA